MPIVDPVTYPALSKYGLLGKTGISGTLPITVANGYWYSPIGITATLVASGSPSGLNSVYEADANTQMISLKTALTELTVTNPDYTGGGTQTITPGVYFNSASTIIFDAGSTLTLDAGGDADARFVFIAGSSITFTDVTAVNLINGAIPQNVLWFASNGSVTFGTGTVPATFPGTIVATTQVIFPAGIQVDGSIYADTDITFVGNSVIMLPSDSVICYFKGTQILTENGYVSVESISKGDKIQTFGDIKSQSEIVPGTNLKTCISVQKRKVTAPSKNTGLICFNAGSLEDGLPTHNLYVSPNHGMVVKNNLVAAKDLVDGTSVFHELSCVDIDYYHVEVEGHSCIKANGALSESFKRRPA